MTDVQQLQGQCLCGAVTIQSRMEAPALRACHCAMCRRQNSGPFFSIANDPLAVEVTGEVAIYQSSEWADRAFCPTCGSTLWYGTRHDGARHLSAGLFEDAGGAPLKLEFFSDLCPRGYALAGEHKRLNTEDTIALFAPKGE